MPKISHAEAMRLSEIYGPDSLPHRLVAFTPSGTPEERQRRLDAWQGQVRQMAWDAANDDEERCG